MKVSLENSQKSCTCECWHWSFIKEAKSYQCQSSETKKTHSLNPQCKQGYTFFFCLFDFPNSYWEEFVEYLNTCIFKEIASKKKVWQVFYVGAFDFIYLWLINAIISFLLLNTEDGFDVCKHESSGPGVFQVVDPECFWVPSATQTSSHCFSLCLCPHSISFGTSYRAKCLLFSLQDKSAEFQCDNLYHSINGFIVLTIYYSIKCFRIVQLIAIRRLRQQTSKFLHYPQFKFHINILNVYKSSKLCLKDK